MPDRLWPVPLTPGVASNFCEYREGHLHAGLDVRTWGREGVECLASADGYVSRVRATPAGYGQAVYLQLDTGETLVYAHLSQFAPAIDSLLTAEQRRVGRYSVDFRPAQNRVRVRRGDVVAWSGSTGGVVPHLHFEVRNDREVPLNPFEHGFALEDTVPPVIDGVAFVPLGKSAIIDGAAFPMEFRTRRVGPGRYTIDDTVGVDGPVALQLRAADRIDANSGRLAPASIEVRRDDELVARLEFQAFSFAQAGEVGFLYDLGHVRLDGDYWFQLYDRPGATLWNRTFSLGGKLPYSYADGSYNAVRVVVTDAAGNRSELAFTVLSGISSRRARARAASPPEGGDIPGVYVYEDMVSVRRGHGIAWEEAPAGAWDDPFGIARVAAGEGLAERPATLRLADGHELTFIGAHAGEAHTFAFPALGVAIDMAASTLYGDVVVYAGPGPSSTEHARRRERAAADHVELVPRTAPVRIGPFGLALAADMTIRFALDGPDSDDAVFRRTERSGRWVYYPSTISGDTVSTTAKRPGVYAVFADRTPPVIRTPLVGTRLVYATGAKVPELVVAIDDDGSGVDYDRCAIFIAGVRQIARWDLSSRRFFITLDDEDIMGPRAVTVVAYDAIGHRSQLDTTVEFPRRTRR